MYSQDLRPGALEHLRIREGALRVREYPELCSDRDRQVLVQRVHFEPHMSLMPSMKYATRTELVHQLPLVLQPRTIMSLLRDILWAAEIEVDRVAVRLHNPGASEQLIRVVAAELDDEGSIETRGAFFALGGVEVLVLLLFTVEGKHLAREVDVRKEKGRVWKGEYARGR